jgi:uncharacterized membrane protein YgcG
MNRLSTTRTRSRIRPRTTVLSGAAIGLLAGAAVYGAVASSSAMALSPTPIKPALVSAVTPHAALAPCGKGQELEHGVCIVHVEHTVTVPAASSGSGYESGSSSSSGSSSGSGSSDSGAHSTEPGEHESSATEHEGASESSEHANEAAHEAAEHAKEAVGNHS